MNLILRSDLRFDTAIPSSVIATESANYEFFGVDSRSFGRVLNLINAGHTSKEISLRTAVPENDIEAIEQHLVKLNLAFEMPSTDLTMSGEDFASICYKIFPSWKRDVFGHPLWVNLVSGSASRTQFEGWVVETYHFILTVNHRMPHAIAQCPSNDAKQIISHHYREEWDHYRFFAKGLYEMGYSEVQVRKLVPLPATLAVVNCMRKAARSDALQYAACSGFLESTGEDRVAGRTFFRKLIENYCATKPGIIQPMIDHIDLDEAYGHNGVLADLAPKLGQINGERVNGALRAVRELVETLRLWSTNIEGAYRDISPFDMPLVRLCE